MVILNILDKLINLVVNIFIIILVITKLSFIIVKDSLHIIEYIIMEINWYSD